MAPGLLRSCALALITAMMVCGALGLAPQADLQQGLAGTHVRPCSALGVYPVGPRVAARQAQAAPLRVYPPPSPWRLVGQIVLAAYTPCGRPTAGTFSVQGLLMGTPIAQSSGVTVTVPCAASCLGPALATIRASGRFAQDAAHGRDPLYVTVAATITSSCSAPPGEIVCGASGSASSSRASRVAFRHVTGYLQVVPAQTATLSFLPPPTVHVSAFPLPLVIYGWRGM